MPSTLTRSVSTGVDHEAPTSAWAAKWYTTSGAASVNAAISALRSVMSVAFSTVIVPGQKPRDEMGADEAVGAGDEGPHDQIQEGQEGGTT